MKVLIVDDCEPIRRMINRKLSRAGWQVIEAENGRIAVDLALAETPDLILMDMFMPVLDGREATRELRERGYGGFICVLTASVASIELETASGAGCDAFLSKPIEGDLTELIRKMLGHD